MAFTEGEELAEPLVRRCVRVVFVRIGEDALDERGRGSVAVADGLIGLAGRPAAKYIIDLGAGEQAELLYSRLRSAEARALPAGLGRRFRRILRADPAPSTRSR